MTQAMVIEVSSLLKNHITMAQASQLFDIPLNTIRTWEKKGLIKAYRTANGHPTLDWAHLEKFRARLVGENCLEFQVLKSNQMHDYKVVELFSGAGGLALGLHNAGLDSCLLVENDKNDMATLKKNKPYWPIIFDDITNVDFTNIKADVVSGGFPCQSFSYAGKGLGFDDIRGTLFFEYARAVQEIQPPVIVVENVRGLEKHDCGKTLAAMLQVLDTLGYRTAYRILKAQYLDVAQKRERLVILGVEKRTQMRIAFPKEHGYTLNLREALKDVPRSVGQKYTEKKHQIMALVPEGGYWRDLPDEIKKEYMGASYWLGGGKTGMARRLSWDEPSLTLTFNPAQKQTERCHPSETRPLTVREYARIQSFPDDWDFHGSISAQYKQIGNAVPVNLGYHIGRCVIAMLSNIYDPATMDIL